MNMEPTNGLIMEIQKLESEKEELLSALKDTLIEAVCLFQHYPNSFRYDGGKDYFKEEVALLKKYKIEI